MLIMIFIILFVKKRSSSSFQHFSAKLTSLKNINRLSLVSTRIVPLSICEPVFYTEVAFLNSVSVPCAQRAAQVSATTMDDALWKPADGTAFASRDGEGQGVTLPWKPFAPMARTTKEVYLVHGHCVISGSRWLNTSLVCKAWIKIK